LIEAIAAMSLIASAFIQALHLFYASGYKSYATAVHKVNVARYLDAGNIPYISIAIPTKDEDPYILRSTLEACLRIEWPRDRIEILVVSDDPEERRGEIARALENLPGYGDTVKLIFRDRPVGRRVGALNTAAQAAVGDILLFLDVDTRPSPGIAQMAVEMIMGGCDAVVFRWKGYYTTPTRLAKALSTAMEFVVGALYRGRSGLGYHIVPLGSGTAYRRDVILRVGGWDNGIVQDDYWMGLKLFREGRRICYCDEEYIEVMVTSTYRAFKIQQSRWSFGAVQAIRKGMGMIRGARAPIWSKVELALYGLQYTPTIAIAFSSYIYPSFLIFHSGPDPLSRIPFIFALWLAVSAIYIVVYIRIVVERLGLSYIEVVKRLGTSSAATSALSFHIAVGQISGLLLDKYSYSITPKGSNETRLNGIGVQETPEIVASLVLLAGFAVSLIRGYILSAAWLSLLALSYLYTLTAISAKASRYTASK